MATSRSPTCKPPRPPESPLAHPTANNCLILLGLSSKARKRPRRDESVWALGVRGSPSADDARTRGATDRGLVVRLGGP